MKNRGAHDVPQLLPSSQPGGVLLQSYITMFQFSPVEITNKNRKDCPKLLKFRNSSITLPSLKSEKKNTAKIEKMNRTNIRSKNTFAKAPTDSVIVYINAYKPSFLPASLTTLVTRITRIILASYGPSEKLSEASADMKLIMTSTRLEMTMNASNLLEIVSK